MQCQNMFRVIQLGLTALSKILIRTKSTLPDCQTTVVLIEVSLGWRWFVLIGSKLSGDSRYRGNVEINVKDRSHICHSGTEWGGTFRFDSCIVSPDSALSSIQLVTRAQFVWQMLLQQLFISLPDHRYGHWTSLCQFTHWFCATTWTNLCL